jgi:hypothetical protein
MTVMTCVTCSVTSSIADVIGTAKTFTARAEVDREEEEKQHKHEHRMIFLLQDPEGPATYPE